MLPCLRLSPGILFLVLLLGGARPAGAQGLDVRAKYEEDLLGMALLRHHLLPDPAPEGKQVEAIVIDNNDVILPGDFPLSSKIPWIWANYLHMRTRRYIVAQELLFSTGAPYRRDLVEESERNLRKLAILSVARIVAAKGSAPDRVVVLVMTKDQWSLRLNTNFTLDQARLDYLEFTPTEMNLLGRNKAGDLDFAFDPGRYTVGGDYTDPRILGSRHSAQLNARLYISRATGQAEGGLAQITAGLPLYSLRTTWGWQAQLYYLSDKVRSFDGGDLRTLCYDPASGAVGLPAALSCPASQAAIPFVYGRQQIGAVLQATRSFGVVNKLNLTAGYRLSANVYSLTDQQAGLSQAAQRAYAAQWLPRSESAAGPFVQLQAYRAEYLRIKNIDTFALTEDYLLGPSLTVLLRYANPNFGYGSEFLEASATYTQVRKDGDNLISIYAYGGLRYQPQLATRCAGKSVYNENAQAEIAEITPRVGPFRLHLHGQVQAIGCDLNNTVQTLGLDSGLRGYAARALAGRQFYLVNAELRTLALNLWTIHVGAVAFYDGGATPRDVDGDPVLDANQDPTGRRTFPWHQDAGVGLRILIPQFNRDVLRLDLAFPFERALDGSYAPRFSAAFGQAF